MERLVQLRPGWAVKAIMVVVIASILFRCVSSATNHTVGGPSGWDLSSNIPAWTSTATFRVGDSLVFSYSPVHDVLEVDESGYATCRALHPLSIHIDGETVVPLSRPGPRFFICGRRGHCAMGLKFRADVLPQPAVSNETRRGGGGGGGGGNRSPPPHRSPPPPGLTPPPAPPGHEFPPLPEPPPFEPIGADGPPPPHEAAPGPCERSGTSGGGGGTVMGGWFQQNYYRWVPLVTGTAFLLHLFTSHDPLMNI